MTKNTLFARQAEAKSRYDAASDALSLAAEKLEGKFPAFHEAFAMTSKKDAMGRLAAFGKYLPKEQFQALRRDCIVALAGNDGEGLSRLPAAAFEVAAKKLGLNKKFQQLLAFLRLELALAITEYREADRNFEQTKRFVNRARQNGGAFGRRR